MTQPVLVYPPHEPVPGPCDTEGCEGGNHVCTVCGGGVDAYTHLPEARGEGAPTALVEAGAAQTVAVEHADTASGDEATK